MKQLPTLKHRVSVKRDIMKIQENKNRFYITIPKDIVKVKRWKKGLEVAVVMDSDGSVRIKEVV